MDRRDAYPHMAKRCMTGSVVDPPAELRSGLLIGVWFINPALDPGEEGPPYPFSVADLTAFFADTYEIVEDYVPDTAFAGREGRERVRVMRRVR